MSTGIENALDAVVARLQANLNAKIDALNAAATDGFTVEHPQTYTVSTRAELGPFPHVMVLPVRKQTEADSGGRIEWRYRVRVLSWVSHPDEEGLGRVLLRFDEAVTQTLLAGRRLDATNWQVSYEDGEPGPVFQPQKRGYYLQGISSIFLMKQEQDVG
jgi:hypothetical protein